MMSSAKQLWILVCQQKDHAEDRRYLPISEMDLRAVLRDVKAVIAELMASLIHSLSAGSVLVVITVLIR